MISGKSLSLPKSAPLLHKNLEEHIYKFFSNSPLRVCDRVSEYERMECVAGCSCESKFFYNIPHAHRPPRHEVRGIPGVTTSQSYFPHLFCRLALATLLKHAEWMDMAPERGLLLLLHVL